MKNMDSDNGQAGAKTGSPAMRIALISDVFFGDDAAARLRARLTEASDLGADLAVLPELPLHSWSPATTISRDEDADPPPPGGDRFRIMTEAAASVGIGLIGGTIIEHHTTGRRYNTALAIDAEGSLIASYAKTHLPEEPGFWETSHYSPGERAAEPIHHWPLPIGLQICSDINRPQGCHLLTAAGAMVILAPRATELATFVRWRPVFIANALTTGCFVLSVNRPGPEQDVLMGGPSIAVSPRGEVLVETTDPVAICDVSADAVEAARRLYPGYLAVRSDMYAAAWSRVDPIPAHAMEKAGSRCADA